MKELTLKRFLEDYPHISLASEADNQDILDFYHQRAMSSDDSKIIYRRGDDFFSFLKERSDTYIVLLMRNDTGILSGMGVLSFRMGYVLDGEKPEMVGYLGDLRVKLNRKLIREWRKMYANLMKFSPVMKETYFCRFYQTVLIDENIESQNNLADTKIPNLEYHRLACYQMVNILGRLKLTVSKSLYRWAKLEDKNLISNFLKNKNKQSLFSYDNVVEFERRLSSWENFGIENFILAFDENLQLVAVSSVWNPIHTKQVVLTKIPESIKLLHKFLRLLPFVEMRDLPTENSPIEILYLNQPIFIDGLEHTKKKQIIQKMLHLSFHKSFHMLAYADFENEQFLNGAKSFFMQKMSMALFSVHYKNDQGEISNSLSWSHDKTTPTFEMSLV